MNGPNRKRRLDRLERSIRPYEKKSPEDEIADVAAGRVRVEDLSDAQLIAVVREEHPVLRDIDPESEEFDLALFDILQKADAFFRACEVIFRE